jgi:hypothetical protein
MVHRQVVGAARPVIVTDVSRGARRRPGAKGKVGPALNDVA